MAAAAAALARPLDFAQTSALRTTVDVGLKERTTGPSGLGEAGFPEKGMRISPRVDEFHLLRLISSVLVASFLDPRKPIPAFWIDLWITIIIDKANSAWG